MKIKLILLVMLVLLLIIPIKNALQDDTAFKGCKADAFAKSFMPEEVMQVEVVTDATEYAVEKIQEVE